MKIIMPENWQPENTIAINIWFDKISEYGIRT